jgi:hypothetical protein
LLRLPWLPTSARRCRRLCLHPLLLWLLLKLLRLHPLLLLRLLLPLLLLHMDLHSMPVPSFLSVHRIHSEWYPRNTRPKNTAERYRNHP